MSTGKCTVREALVVLNVYYLTSKMCLGVDWKLHTVWGVSGPERRLESAQCLGCRSCRVLTEKCTLCGV